MNKTILLAFIVFLIPICVSAQVKGPITVEKKGLRKIYIQDDVTLTPKQLASILQSDEQAKSAYSKSMTSSIVALSTLAVGTAFIGVGFVYTLKAAKATNENDLAGSTEFTDKSNAAMLAGAGFYVISVPFFLLTNSQMNKSIEIYNSSRQTGGISRVDLNIGFTENGAGLRVNF